MASTLHVALQAILRLAGQAILWASVLGVILAGAIAITAWHGRQRSLARQTPARLPVRFPPERTALERNVIDVAAEAAAVLHGLQNLASQQFVRLEMAIQPGLAMVGDQRAFRGALGELVRIAIEQSPCGCVLLTAERVGRYVHASVSDDGPGANGAIRLTPLRDAQRLVTLQGGSLEINARPGEGTTVTVRLPDRDPNGGATGSDRRDRASVWTKPGNKSRADNVAH